MSAVLKSEGDVAREWPSIDAALGTETTQEDRQSSRAGLHRQASDDDDSTVVAWLPSVNLGHERALILDAACGAPSASPRPDGDELEGEREARAAMEERRRQLRLRSTQILDWATGEVWEIEPVDALRLRKAHQVKQIAPVVEVETPTEKLAAKVLDVTEPEELLPPVDLEDGLVDAAGEAIPRTKVRPKKGLGVAALERVRLMVAADLASIGIYGTEATTEEAA